MTGSPVESEFQAITRRLYEVVSAAPGERDWDNERDGISLDAVGLLEPGE